MGATTPVLALPYPLGTDLVKDGDNAIQALAERVEARVGGLIGYAEATAAQSGIAAVETALTGLSLTFSAVANHRYRIVADVRPQASVSGDVFALYLKEGATYLQTRQVVCASTVGLFARTERVVTFTAGSHTVAAYGFRAAGSGTFAVTAAPTAPNFITVEDLGV